jgi:hypothetical protein
VTYLRHSCEAGDNSADAAADDVQPTEAFVQLFAAPAASPAACSTVRRPGDQLLMMKVMVADGLSPPAGIHYPAAPPGPLPRQAIPNWQPPPPKLADFFTANPPPGRPPLADPGTSAPPPAASADDDIQSRVGKVDRGYGGEVCVYQPPHELPCSSVDDVYWMKCHAPDVLGYVPGERPMKGSN